jgi:hypothetical protein
MKSLGEISQNSLLSKIALKSLKKESFRFAHISSNTNDQITIFDEFYRATLIYDFIYACHCSIYHFLQVKLSKSIEKLEIAIYFVFTINFLELVLKKKALSNELFTVLI